MMSFAWLPLARGKVRRIGVFGCWMGLAMGLTLADAEPVIARNTLYFGAQWPSRLVLPILKEDGSPRL